jgi:hypothetical protein
MHSFEWKDILSATKSVDSKDDFFYEQKTFLNTADKLK